MGYSSSAKGREINININQKIIDSGRKFVIAISGGGQEVLGYLTRHGGMSNTLLEGLVPYTLPAYCNLIGGQPDRIVSSESARAAAMACYKRARFLAPSHEKVFGIASTAALARVGDEREGRKHQVFIALQDARRTTVVHVEYMKGGTREQEERATAHCIRTMVGWGCGLVTNMRDYLHEEDKMYLTHAPAEALGKDVCNLVHGLVNKVPDTSAPKAVFSSSCNPFHQGHLDIVRDAEQRLGVPVAVELCIENADKPFLDYESIYERLEQTRSFLGNANEVVLTNVPKFLDKVDLFPGAVFIMGMDTYNRILFPEYYQCDDIMRGLTKMRHCGSRFLVYPRKGYNIPNVTEEITVQHVRSLTDFADYEPSNISSTLLRKHKRAMQGD